MQLGDHLSDDDFALDAAFAGGSRTALDQREYSELAKPYRLQIECSAKCKADCTYCYSKGCSDLLTTDEIKSILSQASELGFKQVDWIGGDPLERDDWIEVMQYARFQRLTNNIWTQGENLMDIANSKHVVELTRGGFVSVHIDSLDPDVLRSVRDSYNPSSIARTLEGLRTVISVGKPVRQICNQLMLTREHNIEDVESTMTSLLNGYGIRTCLMSLKPIEDSDRIVALIPEKDLVAKAYQLRDLLFLGSNTFGSQDFPKQFCASTVFVSASGAVSPCFSFREGVGSIRDRPLSQILSENKAFLLDENHRRRCRANAHYFGKNDAK